MAILRFVVSPDWLPGRPGTSWMALGRDRGRDWRPSWIVGSSGFQSLTSGLGEWSEGGPAVAYELVVQPPRILPERLANSTVQVLAGLGSATVGASVHVVTEWHLAQGPCFPRSRAPSPTVILPIGANDEMPRIVEFWAEIPKLPHGKIDKKAVIARPVDAERDEWNA